MRVDASKSVYHEAASARAEFDNTEIKRCRLLLRRLRFLEAQVRETGGIESGNGGGAFAEMEVDALEWILREVDYIDEPRMEEALKVLARR